MAGLVVVGGAAVVACQPTGLGAATAAYTTQTTATDALRRQHVDVSWLSCTGNYGNGGRTAGRTPSPSETTVVSVDCRGETRDGRRITVTGKVTRAVDGACVRGDLTAKVGGRQVFHVDGLGDCDAAPGPTYKPPTYEPPTYKPPTYKPPTYHPGGGRPTVTVTVTETVWCKGDPTCWPVAGK
ncbi:lipoprotein [Streptomyces alanosinicus]|uniref:Lipoprotein n=1 Tax=Streptomyces alanosinicus TaxID=68171 RepID=A0A919CZZ3_9ACTN|nr:lipoprotein [Streptomyces alanosinicus]